ncbi:MAG TPA: trypsin-like peptidase domain-containing protein [Actinomycetota bacterium]
MRRLPIVMLGLALLAAPACTRTLVERSPSGPPAGVRVGGAGPGPYPVVEVVKKVEPAVVNVTTDLFQSSGTGGGTGRGVGTGFVIRSEGVVVTNFHVVEGAQRITVITSPPESQRYEAHVIGGDPLADLAVLRIAAKDLPTVPLGDSSKLQLGEPVVAIGYAEALPGGPTVTSGIVSALDRTITANDPNCKVCSNGQRTYGNVIQTDAAINPGNSGGPLVNLQGQVVGINTAGASAAQAENIGFAIPINIALPTIEGAVTNPTAPVAYLGVVTSDVGPSLAFQLGLPVQRGAYVVDTAPGGPAEQAGVASGDVIVAFEGKSIDTSQQLGLLIRDHDPGDEIKLEVVTAGGSRRTFTVTLGVSPNPLG